ncbi:hypothetical protein EYF80_050926 [Liparis tanakae]|uniref:Uncharacterized protein n=1 Tax=Liparis tanakae TaxID=230148 RepID=A0A4Z2FDF7_9TELE|nr:hypothetical protein EYF80_050926 [Liparis tanakae]
MASFKKSFEGLRASKGATDTAGRTAGRGRRQRGREVERSRGREAERGQRSEVRGQELYGCDVFPVQAAQDAVQQAADASREAVGAGKELLPLLLLLLLLFLLLFLLFLRCGDGRVRSSFVS